VLVIGKSALLELYRQLPYFREMLGQMFQAHLIEKVNLRNAYLGSDAEEQYKLFVKENPDIASRVSQKDIASFLGSPRNPSAASASRSGSPISYHLVTAPDRGLPTL